MDCCYCCRRVSRFALLVEADASKRECISRRFKHHVNTSAFKEEFETNAKRICLKSIPNECTHTYKSLSFSGPVVVKSEYCVLVEIFRESTCLVK